jgi:hypothetical protein
MGAKALKALALPQFQGCFFCASRPVMVRKPLVSKRISLTRNEQTRSVT